MTRFWKLKLPMSGLLRAKWRAVPPKSSSISSQARARFSSFSLFLLAAHAHIYAPNPTTPQAHTTNEKTVVQGIKYFEFEQEMQKFLAKNRAQHVVSGGPQGGDWDPTFMLNEWKGLMMKILWDTENSFLWDCCGLVFIIMLTFLHAIESRCARRRVPRWQNISTDSASPGQLCPWSARWKSLELLEVPRRVGMSCPARLCYLISFLRLPQLILWNHSISITMSMDCQAFVPHQVLWWRQGRCLCVWIERDEGMLFIFE